MISVVECEYYAIQQMSRDWYLQLSCQLMEWNLCCSVNNGHTDVSSNCSMLSSSSPLYNRLWIGLNNTMTHTRKGDRHKHSPNITEAPQRVEALATRQRGSTFIANVLRQMREREWAPCDGGYLDFGLGLYRQGFFPSASQQGRPTEA